jgi:acyl CoA:acetate/3-ketoacid CoA transferase alpha subunit/acyl CoA:acetate/3-ketoacid CoA transferase beta subunit
VTAEQMPGRLWLELLRERADPSHGNGGTDKVQPLEQTIRGLALQDKSIYFGGSLARPNAALFSVIRNLWATDPQLTIITPSLGNQFTPLVHGRLVRKVISTMHATVYPAPSPNAVYMRADAEKSVSFEDWSLLTLVQRLMAGAFGVPFWPTRSLLNTDLESDLGASGLFGRMTGPFSEDEVGVVPPLNPDVTFIHAAAADAQGNTLISPPWYEDVWAARATDGPVIVTVERVVSAETIRRHSDLVRLPGHAVSAVCPAPFGGHPTQVPAHPHVAIPGYVDDYATLAELAALAADPAGLEAWIQEWIVGVQDHEAYVSKLGSARVNALRGAVWPDGWQFEVNEKSSAVDRLVTAGEMIAALGARVVSSIAVTEDATVALAGAGAATIATWLAALALSEKGRTIDLIAESGLIGMQPVPLDPFLFNGRNLPTCTSLSDLYTTLGVVVGGKFARSIGVLGAGQVDRLGNINSSRVKGKLLTGSGGGNDVCSGAKSIVVTTPHRLNRLVEACDFVTSPGRNVRAIVTDRGVLSRPEVGGAFVLVSVLERDGLTKAELVEAARRDCGWVLDVAPDIEVLTAVTDREIAQVRFFDPSGALVG